MLDTSPEKTEPTKKTRSSKKSRVEVKCPACNNVFLPTLKEKQSRAGKASRRKGANFERNIAKQLQKWWNEGGQYKYEFKRTPMSGGSVLKDGFDMAGDICTNALDFRYHLELKNQPSGFSGLHNWFSLKAKVWKWLEQANVECPPHRIPILIFNRFDMPTYCTTRIDTEDNWITDRLDRGGIPYYTFKYIGYGEVVIWQFKDMLSSKPEDWK